MFKEILSISGKPGLFKLVSQSPKMLVVESIIDQKRMPSYPHEKVSLLKDIAMFAESGEKPLAELLTKAFELENGGKIAVDAKSDAEVLREYFANILPDFDRERIYAADIKKFIQWYNILIEAGITEFNAADDEEEETTLETVVKTPENKPKAVQQQAPKAATKSAASKQSTRVSMKKGS
jgi:hypothetical protein